MYTPGYIPDNVTYIINDRIVLLGAGDTLFVLDVEIIHCNFLAAVL